MMMQTACGTPSYVGISLSPSLSPSLFVSLPLYTLHPSLSIRLPLSYPFILLIMIDEAPEVLNASGYGKEVDMWSIGVITYILLCGFPPFYGDTVPEIFEQIMEANFDYPEEYWNTISKEGSFFYPLLFFSIFFQFFLVFFGVFFWCYC